MAEISKRKPSRDKVRAHRERMRAQGLRPVVIWAPETRSPEFIEQVRREARLIAESPHEAEDQAFVDAISEDLWK